MLADLQWPSLQHRRYVTRLKVFYNIVYSSSVLTVPNYFTNTTYPTRHHHPFHFEIPFARTDHYKFKFPIIFRRNLPEQSTFTNWQIGTQSEKNYATFLIPILN